MKAKIDIPMIPEAEQTPLIQQLLEIIKQQALMIQQQGEEIHKLRDEIARLKKGNPRPKIEPSRMENGGKKKDKSSSKKKRPGSAKRSKNLDIHETQKIPPDTIPDGSVFKGYKEYVVQGLIIKPHNTRFLLERWQTPDGSYVVGELPASLQGKHFDPVLVSYILNQYYHALVTQPLLLEQLHDWDVDISAGQLNNIIIEGKESFHEEKDGILAAGLRVSDYVNVDDTGARHAGKNGYCTHIGNELFTWFESTDSKSRLNFLRLLRTGPADYVVNGDALEYIQKAAFPKSLLVLLGDHGQTVFLNDIEWSKHLKRLGIRDKRHVRIATEGVVNDNYTSRLTTITLPYRIFFHEGVHPSKKGTFRWHLRPYNHY